jgi:hypothetical protein
MNEDAAEFFAMQHLYHLAQKWRLRQNARESQTQGKDVLMRP